jgi:hypothetical protein
MTFRPYATRCPVLRAQLPRSGGYSLKNLEEKAPMARTRQDIGKVFTPSTISYVVLYIYIWLAAIPKYIYGAVRHAHARLPAAKHASPSHAAATISLSLFSAAPPPRRTTQEGCVHRWCWCSLLLRQRRRSLMRLQSRASRCGHFRVPPTFPPIISWATCVNPAAPGSLLP